VACSAEHPLKIVARGTALGTKKSLASNVRFRFDGAAVVKQNGDGCALVMTGVDALVRIQCLHGVRVAAIDDTPDVVGVRVHNVRVHTASLCPLVEGETVPTKARPARLADATGSVLLAIHVHVAPVREVEDVLRVGRYHVSFSNASFRTAQLQVGGTWVLRRVAGAGGIRRSGPESRFTLSSTKKTGCSAAFNDRTSLLRGRRFLHKSIRGSGGVKGAENGVAAAIQDVGVDHGGADVPMAQ